MSRKYIDKEKVEEVKRIDLLTFLRQYEPHELVKSGGNSYCLRSHDSLKISNGKWMWHSRGIGGRSALDYLIKVKDMEFYDAVALLLGNSDLQIESTKTPKEYKNPPVIFKLPKPYSDNGKVKTYLMSRGIHPAVIDYCIENKMLYEEALHHNVVFVGFNENQEPAYASFRSSGKKRVLGDVSGSNKAYAFQLHNGIERTVHVFESAIDTLSYATVLWIFGKDFKSKNLLSLEGISGSKVNDKSSAKVPVALEKYLEMHPETDQIILHLDNDFAGRTATEKIKNLLEKQIFIKDSPPISGKDVNDFLVEILQK